MLDFRTARAGGPLGYTGIATRGIAFGDLATWHRYTVVFMSILFADLLLHHNPPIPFVGHGVRDETVGEDDYRGFEPNLGAVDIRGLGQVLMCCRIHSVR